MWHLQQGDIDNLNSSQTPHLHLFVGDYMNLADELNKGKMNDFFVLDAAKMTDVENMLEEFVKALKFPAYFGSNLNALWDFLTDLRWLDQDSHILVFRNSQALLKNEETLDIVISFLKDAAIYWAIPSGEDNGRHNSVAFNTIFQVDDSKNKFAEALEVIAGERYWGELNNFWNRN